MRKNLFSRIHGFRGQLPLTYDKVRLAVERGSQSREVMRQSLGVLMDRQNAPNPAERADPAASNGVVQRFPLPEVPDHYNTPFIPLNVLIDFAVQHCFHELTVLAELLPKKKETERKISVIQFAHSTRCIFLKLLALVKWLRQTRKLDITKNICFHLDQISFEFVETADILCHLRDELLSARMPIFQVQHAMEAVSTGRCIRIPQCIRKRYIPELTLKPKKQALTLYRLNQLIQRRLALEAANLPAGYNSVEVRNGTAILTAYNEFEATVSLLPPSPGAEPQWLLLHLNILVEDYEVGQGAPLVHPMQTNYLHEMCQHKMKEAENPLTALYEVLHKFCMKLQLDVLYCQGLYLVRSISPKFLAIESYDPRKESLVFSYWSQRKSQRPGKKTTQFESDYRIHIWRNQKEPNSILQIRHSPPTRPLPGLYKDNGSLTSIHRLVSETVLLRCGERLDQVFKLLKSITEDVKSEKPKIRMVGTAAVRLLFDLLPMDDCVDEEALQIAMNAFTGELICTVPALAAGRRNGREIKDLPELEELENNLKLKAADKKSVKKALQRLQIKLLKQRFEWVPAVHYRKVFEPFVNITCKGAKQIPQERICFQFCSEPKYFLLVGFQETAEVESQLRLFLCNTCGTKLSAIDLMTCNIVEDFSKKPDVFDRNLYDLAQNINAKMFFRANSRANLWQSLNRLSEKLLIERMNDQLRQLRINSSVWDFCEYRGYRVELLDFSSCDLPKEVTQYAQSLHHCRISTSVGRVIQWVIDMAVEYPATSIQLPSNALKSHKEVVIRHSRRFPFVQYLPAVSMIQCSSVCHALAIAAIERIRVCAVLHEPVRELELAAEVRRNVNIVDFHHYRLTIAYGEDRRFLMSVIYKPKLRGFGIVFTQAMNVQRDQRELMDSEENMVHISKYGIEKIADSKSFNEKETKNHVNHEIVVNGEEKELVDLNDYLYGYPQPPNPNKDASWNAHCIVAQHLTDDFNRNKDLVGLVHYLQHSYKVMDALKWIRPKRPHVLEEFDEKLEQKPPLERQAFVRDLKLNLITLSQHRMRLVMGVCHLELHLVKDNQVAIEGSIITDKRYHFQTMDEMPMFVEFWKFWSDGTATVIFDNNSNILEEDGNNPSPATALSPYTSHNGPPSAPSRSETTRSPQNRPNSAAGVYMVNSPGVQTTNTASTSQNSQQKKDGPPKRLPTVIVSADSLETVLSNYRFPNPDDVSEPTPLEQYLYAINAALFLQIPFQDSEDLKNSVKGIRRQIRPSSSPKNSNGSAKNDSPAPQNGRSEVEVTLD
ncbi:unnamed protein product [Bursaphelenchus xylophilus]|uniref:Mediator of RNA polymerase II transcription subunit 14 n=1 Tax=Bursaphelenchus xylophilus TaxID=6326 RepID=A0A7I8X400_BURXY|nr:unnamed protein product [Bursaphelenchus xylophilus]CAG9128847.1 unnamed protein product [Bursaphelenchus xylophilus]